MKTAKPASATIKLNLNVKPLGTGLVQPGMYFNKI